MFLACYYWLLEYIKSCRGSREEWSVTWEEVAVGKVGKGGKRREQDETAGDAGTEER